MMLSTSACGRLARRVLIAACLIAVAIPAGFGAMGEASAAASDGGGKGGGRGGGGGGAGKGSGGSGGGLSDAMIFFVEQNCTAGAACGEPRPERPRTERTREPSCQGVKVYIDRNSWYCERDFY